MNDWVASLRQLTKFFIALGILLMCLYSAKLMVLWWQIPLPSPLVAMLILLLLLASKIMQPSWLEPACTPILKYMALFFIPAGVGIVQYTSLLALYWPVLLCTVILVPVVGLTLVGFAAKKGLKND
ncbi:CidA/LrgA family protein [Pseudoalteromonas sp. JBTF-M23]|uniref:CidA/LrgA family protein n=1 Tax=Pseudoalteromonas caenipelagi TaxID=2726988 RepID=A0A849V8T4_9GAMM|nr:CidA/LrgA family protein [Pseudoalteromonas caenipelagi]NOU49742.1 CidA/LrgA family protein [Pseudoalteromonas caenipelagi]